MTIVEATCYRCKKGCRLLRCSRCRNVCYCSIQCQKADWKAGHRAKCGRVLPNKEEVSSTQAQEAWNELKKCLINTSAEEAHKKYQIAAAEKERLQTNDVMQRSSPLSSGKGVQSKDQSRSPLQVNQDDDKQQPTEIMLSNTLDLNQRVETEASSIDFTRKWTFAIEEMPNISCYSVTLRRIQDNSCDQEDIISLDALQLSMQPLPNGDTTVTLVENGAEKKLLFSVRFPAKLVRTTAKSGVLQIEPDAICLRLQSESEMSSIHSQYAATSVDDLNSLKCSCCDFSLLNEQPITKVLPLARGYWDEVADYLICYNGAPAVDFASAAATVTKGVAMEDSGFIVMHREDVGNSVCILAVEGYGAVDERLGKNRNSTITESDATVDITENQTYNRDLTQSITFRGPRSWQDSVGGATICCGQCCLTLGFASIESLDTFRLLKHRLSSGDGNAFRSYTSTSFVTREMVRYAESKAIFTFVITTQAEEKNAKRRDSEHQNASGQCLLLRILSWDTRLATTASSVDSDNGLDTPKFVHVIKVIYELTNDKMMDDSDVLTSWTWGGVDLCCPPTNFSRGKMNSQPEPRMETQSQHSKNSSVRLHLSQQEWTELQQSLQEGSRYFSQAVADATILLKLGHAVSADGRAGLSALPRL